MLGHLFKNFYLSLCLVSLLGSSLACAGKERRGQVVRDDMVVDYLSYEAEGQPVAPDLKRTVVVLPPTGGTGFLDKKYARLFSGFGAQVYILDRWTGDDEVDLDLSIHQKLFGRFIKAIDILLEDVVAKDHQVSLMGTSVGGMGAALAASVLPNLERVLVIGAGAPFADIIVQSDQKDLLVLKEKRVEKFGFLSDMEYLKALTQVYDLEPFLLPKMFKDKKLGLVLLTKDTTVPTVSQKRLFNLWEPEFYLEVNRAHVRGILSTYFRHRQEVRKFVVPESVNSKPR